MTVHFSLDHELYWAVKLVILSKTNFCIFGFYRWWWSIFPHHGHWLFSDLGVNNINNWHDLTCISGNRGKKQSAWFSPRIRWTSEWIGKYSWKQRRVSRSRVWIQSSSLYEISFRTIEIILSSLTALMTGFLIDSDSFIMNFHFLLNEVFLNQITLFEKFWKFDNETEKVGW